MPRSRWFTACVGLGAAVSWLVAASGHVAWFLASRGLLPGPLVFFTWPRGPICWVRFVAGVVGVVLTAVLVRRLFHRWWLALVVALPTSLMIIPAIAVPYPGAQIAFDAWRPALVQIASSPKDSPASGMVEDYYGTPLPPSFAPFTALGTVDHRADGSIFFAEWSGVPDDAGGYWYTATGSPKGRDMWGMTCSDPLELEPHWWACGMKLDGAPLW